MFLNELNIYININSSRLIDQFYLKLISKFRQYFTRIVIEITLVYK
jgi:hypothetical protein